MNITPQRHLSLRIVFATLCLVSAAPHAMAAGAYRLTDLGVVAGYSQSFSYGLSDNGQYVAGWVQQGTVTQGFRWSAALGMELLPLTGGGTSATASRAFSVNDSGVAVGESVLSATVRGATAWDTAGQTLALGTLPNPAGAAFSSVAFGINNSGTVAGWSDSADNTRAFTWTASVGMASLGALPGGTQTRAYSINAAGDVVGWGTTAGADRGFWATPGLTSVGAVSAAAASRTRAFGISNNGWVTGDARDPAVGDEAFAWSALNGLVTLGKMAGASSSFGADINSSGAAVGWNQGGANGDEAYLWSQQDGMLSLNSLLVDAAGWNVQRARAINDAGVVVANAVAADGSVRAVLLTPVPEPGSWALVGVALLGLTATSRQRRGSRD